jgi:hypothetical protein
MKLFKLLTGALAIFILWNSCTYNDLGPASSEDLKITLRWVKAYPDETKEDILNGLAWSLSFLGAELPSGSMQRAIEWQSDTHFIIDFTKTGFNTGAQAALQKIIPALKNSDEYNLLNGIDLGRFVMLTLNSSHHYFAITGASEKYTSFRGQYSFDQKKAAILQSTIAFGNRLIEVSTANHALQIAFVATEGNGSIEEGTFNGEEFETIDIMKNGQLRIGLYDADGNLKVAASPTLTAAGKPSKCLWCHETSLQPPYNDNHTLTGYYSTAEFKAKVNQFSKLIEDYRTTLVSDVDFTQQHLHTKAELLYLSFTEPSAERLAEEWGLTLEETRLKLQGLSTHAHGEFALLGKALYFRSDVESLAPFEPIRVPDDSRDVSMYEPDFIH